MDAPLMKVKSWVCVPHNADADHDWKLMSDSYGADDVVNGTVMEYWWECEQCGLIDQYREVTTNDISAWYNSDF